MYTQLNMPHREERELTKGTSAELRSLPHVAYFPYYIQSIHHRLKSMHPQAIRRASEQMSKSELEEIITFLELIKDVSYIQFLTRSSFFCCSSERDLRCFGAFWPFLYLHTVHILCTYCACAENTVWSTVECQRWMQRHRM